jgi:uncharacterized protein YjbJ (UPF0337 family)
MGEMIDKIKGRLKQAVGGLTGSRKLTREGQADENKGKVEGAAKDVKHAVEDVKQAIKEVAK